MLAMHRIASYWARIIGMAGRELAPEWTWTKLVVARPKGKIWGLFIYFLRGEEGGTGGECLKRADDAYFYYFNAHHVSASRHFDDIFK